MNYKKLEINDINIDEEIKSILVQIARWHNLTPKLWRSDYKISAEDIDRTVERIHKTKSQDLFLTIVEDEQGEIQGFIWAYKQEESQNSVMILSLYVTEDYRGRGIATRLKELLEQWCRLEGIKTINTTTHYNNHNMIKLNKKLGYIPGMVYMSKTL
ncbi:GNAT family N-acetyltransferase [Clostridium sp. D2Q-14]|uniref:GNAT family N-acetyltransferase n=1 Tax=Anaeromonas gelatinilytica TaxID=2683194 RepID=UPI00193B2EC3|nr:GNAT family N-acetyltransferase [Anaeromonas gelatinilytica]MBS4535720.1 GNAT family N-acetyltransferase [Anaeromonas gelatinilytica]